jgi:hypothetical protein
MILYSHQMLQLSLSVKMFTILGEIPTSSMTKDDLDGAFVLAKRAFVRPQPSIRFRLVSIRFRHASIRSTSTEHSFSSREHSYSSCERSFDLNRAFVLVSRAFVGRHASVRSTSTGRSFSSQERSFSSHERSATSSKGTFEPWRTDECHPSGLDYRLARIALTHASSNAYVGSRRSLPMSRQRTSKFR